MVLTSVQQHPSWRERPNGAIDALLALVVLVAAMVAVGPGERIVLSPPDAAVEHLVLACVATAFIARRLPFIALGLATILDAVPFWLPISGAGYHVCLMIATYTVVARRPSRQALPAVAGVLAVQVGLMAWEWEWLWLSTWVAAAGITTALPAALGLAARSRGHAAAALEQRALAAERSRDSDARKLLAEDRLRTARNLHDSVAHQISVMNLNAGVVSRSLRDRPDEAEAALVTIREAGREVISSISELLTSLRDDPQHEQEERHDLSDVRQLAEEFRQLSPTLAVSVNGPPPTGDTVIGPAIYHVVREALTNAYKHGVHDAPMAIRIEVDGSTSRVRVTNACGTESITSTGFGLTGMRERVAAAGGHLTIDHGTSVFSLDASVPHVRAVS